MRNVVLLSWWFLAVAGGTYPQMLQVGPFDNEAECNRIKAESRETNYLRVSSCWHTQ